MEVINVRNLVILALAQIGIIVGAVLGAGVTHKWQRCTFAESHIPALTDWLIDYGWLCLPIPALWLGLTLKVFLYHPEEEEIQMFAVFSGVGLFVLWLALAWSGALLPWLQSIARWA